MKLIKLLLLSFVATGFLGCGTAVYIPEDNLTEGHTCKVTVFRDRFTLMWSMNIKADGRTYAKLSDNTYTSFYMEEGEHTISAVWNIFSGGVDLHVPIECKSGQEVYVAFNGYVSGRYRNIEGGQISPEEVEKRLATYKKAGGT